MPTHICHGWAVCHSNRGRDRELIALRIIGAYDIPEPSVPLFSSGTQAATHGMKGINRPGKKAKATMAKLLRKYRRLRT